MARGEESLRVGVIGLGSWAREVHLPNLRQIPRARVTALCSRSDDNLRAGLEALGGEARCFHDWRELLAWDGCDAVLVCAAPNTLHEEMAAASLEAGKHVYCEKPVSLTLEGCRRLSEAVTASGRVFQAGLELRSSDVAARVKDLVQSGAIGRPGMLWTVILRDWGSFSGWRGDKQRSGGIHHELSCHYLDLFAWMLDASPERIQSAGHSLLGGPVEDHLWTTLEFPGGCLANLGICMFAAARNEIPIEVVGDTGRISADIISGSVRLLFRTGGVEDRSPERPSDYSFHGFPGSLEALRAFVEAAAAGRQGEPGVGAATQAVRLALLAERAMAERRTVTWDEAA